VEGELIIPAATLRGIAAFAREAYKMHQQDQ
jgi:hypothetical protein